METPPYTVVMKVPIDANLLTGHRLKGPPTRSSDHTPGNQGLVKVNRTEDGGSTCRSHDELAEEEEGLATTAVPHRMAQPTWGIKVQQGLHPDVEKDENSMKSMLPKLQNDTVNVEP